MLRVSRFGAGSLAAIILSLMFADAWAQSTQPTQPGGTQTRPGTTQEQLPPQDIRPPLIEPTPQAMSYPLEFLGLLAPPPGAEEAALAVVMTGGEIVTALSFLSHATSNRMINEKRFKDSPRRT